MRFIRQESLLTLWCFQTHRSCRPQIASSYKFFTPLPNFVTLMVPPLSLFLSFCQREQHPSCPLEILTLYYWIVLVISYPTRQLPSPIQLLNSLSTVMYYYSLVRNIKYRFKRLSPISSSSSTVQLCSKLLLQLPLFSFLFFSLFSNLLLKFQKKLFLPYFFADSYSLTTQNIIWSFFLQTTLKVCSSIFLSVLLFKTAFLHLLLLLMVEKFQSFFYLHNYVHSLIPSCNNTQAGKAVMI